MPALRPPTSCVTIAANDLIRDAAFDTFSHQFLLVGFCFHLITVAATATLHRAQQIPFRDTT